MWAKVAEYLQKYVLSYLLEVIVGYIKYKIEEHKLKKRVKEKINEIKKTSETKKEAARHMRDFLNS